jgi:MCP family monocarboxylic acid transporter-like MFS transporter 10
MNNMNILFFISAWVGSISVNLLFLFSPVTSRLAERYGVRTVTIAGGIVISCGLFLSAYAPSLLVMYLTYGLLFGIGTSLCGTMALIVTMEYFDKHLSLATGIASSGSRFGTLSLAPLLQYLLGRYGWQLTFKMFGCVGILLAVVGLVFRPIQKRNNGGFHRRRSSQDHGSCITKHTDCRKFDLFDCSVLKNKAFILWIIATSSAGFGYFIPHFFLVSWHSVSAFSRVVL